MKYYTVVLRLSGALSNAVAVEWTNRAAPVDSGQGWEPCLRQADGTWRFASHDPFGADQPHRRAPGAFGDLAIRYRLEPAGPWSAASKSRKEIVLLEVIDAEEQPVQPGPAAPPAAPFLALAPVLAGAGKIGAEVTVAPGFWGGEPAPDLAFQWRRDGIAIPGAVARVYTPGPADDRTDLDCVVTARNAAGALTATTAALRVTYPAPAVFGDLGEEVFDEGAGPQSVETAQVFAGAALVFSARGAAIDARTGVLRIATDAPVSGVVVTVTATNSGGAVSATLRVTVEETPVEEPAPWPLDATELQTLRSVWRPLGQAALYTPIFGFPGLVGETVAAIEWTTSLSEIPPEAHWEIAVPRDGAPGEYELYMRDPAKRDPLAEPKVDFAVFGLSAGETTRTGRIRFRWRRTAGGAWSGASEPALLVGPPVALGAIPAQEIRRGVAATLDVAAFATGEGLTYAVSASPAAAWITIAPATGLLTMTAPNGLTYPATLSVTVTVTDARGQKAAVTFALTARDTAPADGDAARLWRPLHHREKVMFEAAADHPKYYARGKYWGEGFQYAHCFVREGKRVAFGGDMCGFRLSDDGGQTYYWPRAEGKVASQGLRGNVFHGIGIDPDDIDVILVAVGPSVFSPNYASGGADAIYRSTDGGKSFATAQAMDNLTDRRTTQMRTFCYFAGSGSATPATRRWRFMEGNEGVGNRYWGSNDGGRTWALRAALPAGMLGQILYGVVQHPSNANIQFALTEGGLWRTTNDGATTAGWARIGNASGKLDGAVTSLWIDPDAPDVMLASRSRGGLFYTANGGTSGADWTNVLPKAANDVSNTTVAVGPKDSAGRRTIYTCHDRKDTSHRNIYVQHWLASGPPATAKAGQLAAGAAAPMGQWFRPRTASLGAGVREQHWMEMMGQGQCVAVPDETDASRCGLTGYGLQWFSKNRGADWSQAAGFGGMNSMGIAFDPSNVKHLFLALNDIQGCLTENCPDWMTMSGLTPDQKNALYAQAGYDDSGAHGKHAVFVPNHPSVPAAKRHRLLASIGNYTGGQQIYRKNKLATGWAEAWTPVTGSIDNIPEFFTSAANPNVIYAGSLRSLDAGDSFQNVMGCKICAVSQQNPAIVFGTTDDQTIRRSVSYGGTGGAAVLGVAGAAWTTWFSNSRKLAQVERKVNFWLSPHDHRRGVIHTNSGDFALLEGDATARVTVQIGLAEAYAKLGFNDVTPINLTYATWDPTNAQRFYIHAKMFGRPMIWRITFNAGFTAVASIEDITRNAPTTANNRQIKVHPITGDVFVSSGGGIWVLPAPGALRSDSLWSLLPQPFPSNGVY